MTDPGAAETGPGAAETDPGAAGSDSWSPLLGAAGEAQPAQRGSDLIYRAIRQSIVSGRIPQWTRLVEEELAEQFGVSRSPVREALRHLEYDGLAQRFRRGMLVAVPFGDREREDIHLIRVEMDRLAARLVVQRAGPAEWVQPREAVARLASARQAGSSPGAVSMAHLEVHTAINWVAFGSRLGGLMTRSLGLYSGLADTDYVQQPGFDPVEQHLALIAELASGDEARALAAMDKHALRGGGATTGG